MDIWLEVANGYLAPQQNSPLQSTVDINGDQPNEQKQKLFRVIARKSAIITYGVGRFKGKQRSRKKGRLPP